MYRLPRLKKKQKIKLNFDCDLPQILFPEESVVITLIAVCPRLIGQISLRSQDEIVYARHYGSEHDCGVRRRAGQGVEALGMFWLLAGLG